MGWEQQATCGSGIRDFETFYQGCFVLSLNLSRVSSTNLYIGGLIQSWHNPMASDEDALTKTYMNNITVPILEDRLIEQLRRG